MYWFCRETDFHGTTGDKYNAVLPAMWTPTTRNSFPVQLCDFWVRTNINLLPVPVHACRCILFIFWYCMAIDHVCPDYVWFMVQLHLLDCVLYIVLRIVLFIRLHIVLYCLLDCVLYIFRTALLSIMTLILTWRLFNLENERLLTPLTQILTVYDLNIRNQMNILVQLNTHLLNDVSALIQSFQKVVDDSRCS